MQVDEFVGGNVGGLGCGDAVLSANAGGEDAGGLFLAVASNESFLFCGADAGANSAAR